MDDKIFEGLPVLSLFPDSPAERAGIRVGDRVLLANGCRIESLQAYIDARAVHRDRLELTLQRGHQIFERVLFFNNNNSHGAPDTPAPN